MAEPLTRVPLCTVSYCPAKSSDDWHHCFVCKSPHIDHHHVETRGMGGSKKPQQVVVPLCRKHHELITIHKWGNAVIPAWTNCHGLEGKHWHYVVFDTMGKEVVCVDVCQWVIGEGDGSAKGRQRNVASTAAEPRSPVSLPDHPPMRVRSPEEDWPWPPQEAQEANAGSVRPEGKSSRSEDTAGQKPVVHNGLDRPIVQDSQDGYQSGHHYGDEQIRRVEGDDPEPIPSRDGVHGKRESRPGRTYSPDYQPNPPLSENESDSLHPDPASSISDTDRRDKTERGADPQWQNRSANNRSQNLIYTVPKTFASGLSDRDVVPTMESPSVSYERRALVIEGPLSWERYESLCNSLQVMHDAVNIWIGDCIVAGEREFNERAYQPWSDRGFKPEALRQYAWVASRVPRYLRNTNLDYSHFRAVAALPEAQQAELLERAQTEGMTVSELRECVAPKAEGCQHDWARRCRKCGEER